MMLMFEPLVGNVTIARHSFIKICIRLDCIPLPL